MFIGTASDLCFASFVLPHLRRHADVFTTLCNQWIVITDEIGSGSGSRAANLEAAADRQAEVPFHFTHLTLLTHLIRFWKLCERYTHDVVSPSCTCMLSSLLLPLIESFWGCDCEGSRGSGQSGCEEGLGLPYVFTQFLSTSSMNDNLCIWTNWQNRISIVNY